MDRIDLVQSLISQIRKVTLVHSKYINKQRQYFDGDNLYMREAHFIMAIGIDSYCTMTELAEKLDVTPGAVSQLALKMEKKGYVQRTALPQDKRSNIIRLTEKGEELYKEHKKYDNDQYGCIAELLSEYTEEEIISFLSFEQKLVHIFKQKDEIR